MADRRMRCTKTTLRQTPSSGDATARRLTLAADSTLVSIGNHGAVTLYYLFGGATVDCTGVSTAHGSIMPGGKETEIPVPSGPTYTCLSVEASADCDVDIEEGVTLP